MATWIRRGLMILVVIAGAALVWGIAAPPEVTQPIRFSHALHVKSNVQCRVCHQHYTSAPAAGLPTAETCSHCHEDVIHVSREKRKLMAYYASGQPIPWRRVLQLPGHVYFSHRRHVAAGGLECQTCHGDVAAQEEPLTRPLRPLRMADCIECHTRLQARTSLENVNECIRCHR